MENVPSFQQARELEEFTEEQEAYVDQFMQERIAAGFSTPALAEPEAEEHLRLAYQVVGLAPPQIRWFDSPIAFLLAPEPAPQSIETLIRTSVEARVAATLAESVSEFVWESLSTMLNVIGESVWGSVGRLLEDAVLESVGSKVPKRNSVSKWPSRLDLQISLWSVAGASLQTDDALCCSRRIKDSVQAYANLAWLAFPAFFAHVLEPYDLIHLACFNELVSGYRLGRTEALVVDLGKGSERTGYAVHIQDDGPRVCLLPRVFFELHCQQHCSRTRPCPLLSDLPL